MQLSGIKGGDNQEGHSFSRQASWRARLSFPMSQRRFYKFRSHHWSAKRSANNRLVCSRWWTKSLSKTNTNKHRRISRVAHLKDSENVRSSALSQQNKHPPQPFSYSSCQWLSTVSVLCLWCLWDGMDTLKPHLSCDAAGLEWGLGICIPKKHSMNRMAGPWAILGRTLKCLKNVTKHWFIVCDFRWSFKLNKAFK